MKKQHTLVIWSLSVCICCCICCCMATAQGGCWLKWASMTWSAAADAATSAVRTAFALAVAKVTRAWEVGTGTGGWAILWRRIEAWEKKKIVTSWKMKKGKWQKKETRNKRKRNKGWRYLLRGGLLVEELGCRLRRRKKGRRSRKR